MNYSVARRRFVDWIGVQLTGPASTDSILNGVHPTERYPIGYLSPLVDADDFIDADENNEADLIGVAAEENSSDATAGVAQAAGQRRFAPPSSAGLSFYLVGSQISFQVVASAVRYKNVTEREQQTGRFGSLQYQRHHLSLPKESLQFKLPAELQRNRARHVTETLVFDCCARLDVVWRPHAAGWIVTVSLSNQQTLADQQMTGNRHGQGGSASLRQETTLFEVALQVVIDDGRVGDYPRVSFALLSEEERELEFQYRQRKIYAVGHGAAVDWSEDNGRVQAIWLDFLPTVEVPQLTADTVEDSSSALNLAWLGGELLSGEVDNTVLSEQVLKSLTTFTDGYQSWVNQQHETAEGAPVDVNAATDDNTRRQQRETAQKIVARMHVTLARMRAGIKLLGSDNAAAHSFRIANIAMLRQMQQQAHNRGKAASASSVNWRPFQLAFLLTVVDSAVSQDDPFRDTVDLIWFPTGGGKTEAYLALIAFVLSYRRLRQPQGASSPEAVTDGLNSNIPPGTGGTAVLMRYTLRLLTAQQFLRACKMICALELVRRTDSRLGSEPFSCGLWVGGAASPNHFSQAMDVVATIASGNTGARKRLVFDSCPWCEAAFTARNYAATDRSFAFCCNNADCDFGSEENTELPCNVVDEALYQAPPSLLLATLDKFARMVWDERTSVFLGAGTHLPPELIVQDELHLVAGALGSVAGLYEAALDTVLLESGMRAKYVASTATIRMAGEQVERLYGRSLAVFPPPGLSADDSYFARTVALEDRPGRLYAGFLAPLLGSNNCMVPLVAAIMRAPLSVFGEGEIDRDELLEAWWTLVVYHGSLKGVGNSHNNFSAAIRDGMARLMKESENRAAASSLVSNESQDTHSEGSVQYQQQDVDSTQEDHSDSAGHPDNARSGTAANTARQAPSAGRGASAIARDTLRVAQLTSQSSAEENAATFNQLEKTRGQDDYLDAVLATNMISVGLDVSRLALMVINGQPLTTAEYIQTSSRVGRGDVPGLVFTNYYRSQARSLSHYENFRAYHESFYRFVEPTSVTPFTHQARQRALHTALVLVVRHACAGLLQNNTAGQFDLQDATVQSAIAQLKKRCAAADPDRANQVAVSIDMLATQWADYAAQSAFERVQLNYSAPNNDIVARRLLHSFEDETNAPAASRGLWPALNSMRNVEKTALLRAASVSAKEKR